jgi:hypothetical protein
MTECVICGRRREAHEPTAGRLQSWHSVFATWADVQAAERAAEAAQSPSKRRREPMGAEERRQRGREAQRRREAALGDAAP